MVLIIILVVKYIGHHNDAESFKQSSSVFVRYAWHCHKYNHYYENDTMITMSFIIFSEALKSLFMMIGLPTVSAAHGMKVVSNYIVITDNDDDDDDDDSDDDDDDVIFDKWQSRVTLWSGET